MNAATVPVSITGNVSTVPVPGPGRRILESLTWMYAWGGLFSLVMQLTAKHKGPWHDTNTVSDIALSFMDVIFWFIMLPMRYMGASMIRSAIMSGKTPQSAFETKKPCSWWEWTPGPFTPGPWDCAKRMLLSNVADVDMSNTNISGEQWLQYAGECDLPRVP